MAIRRLSVECVTVWLKLLYIKNGQAVQQALNVNYTLKRQLVCKQ